LTTRLFEFSTKADSLYHYLNKTAFFIPAYLNFTSWLGCILPVLHPIKQNQQTKNGLDLIVTFSLFYVLSFVDGEN
jgi:hypothetical protein